MRASTGLPSARQRFARVPVEAGPGRYGSARMPAVHEDLTVVPGAVPLSGVVKGRAIDQRNSFELVAFGEHGAVSEIQ